ncbi:MAG: glycogen debranching protein, partial [Flavobacteriaceae bacterium]|nr:glycogen debranching protein [Flavobacteriaceae bacterium]
AWNIYSFAVPIVQQFFGISPGAHKKIVGINPQMPSSWNDAALENVMVGDNMISIYFKREGKQETLTVTQSATDWTLELGAEYNPGVEYEFLEGNVSQGEDGVLRSSDQKVVLRKHFP